MPTYTALTVGPIYKTFAQAKKTRELWGASFCFSFLMREINRHIRENGKIKNDDFILPFMPEEEVQDLLNKKGIGLFPDRLIFKSAGNGIDIIRAAIDAAIEALDKHICNTCVLEIGMSKNYLKNYFQFYYLEKELSDTESNQVILSLSPYLNSMEQQQRFLKKEPVPNYLFTFLKNINKRNNDQSFLKDFYEIEDANGNKRIESLIEIATREFKNKSYYRKLVNESLWDENNKSDIEDPKNIKDISFIEALSKKDKDNYKSYHKYICILTADGDKMGATLQGLNTPSEQQTFSKKLTKWATESYDAVKEYGGVPIFIGGDDLLCFAPVSCNNENIYDLIDKVDQLFKNQFPESFPTLSFGLSITYYKYPMTEALEKAFDLLHEAKEAGGNSIAQTILKHSGSSFTTLFYKDSSIYRDIFKKQVLPLLNDKENHNSAVSYKLRENTKVFEEIIHQPERVINFINNNFDVKDEGKISYEELIKKVNNNNAKKEELLMRNIKDIINQIYSIKQKKLITAFKTELANETLADVYSILRISKFVKGLEDADK